jgi:carboxymethylenebutenolidase
MSTPLSIHEPTGRPRGGIVVVQEAFGVNAHIDDVTRRFAQAGYLSVAPHLFHRTGDPAFGYDDMLQVMPHMKALRAEQVLEDVDAALDHLVATGIEAPSIGVVGFCMGGTVALQTAVERPIGAAVTFYGGGVKEGRFGFPSLVEQAPKLRAPWLGLYGDLDTGIPVDDVEELRTAAMLSGQPTEVVRYADAEHGFNCDLRVSYHQPSATDAWARALAWFARYLDPCEA